jgi:hypothetical protein
MIIGNIVVLVTKIFASYNAALKQKQAVRKWSID